MVLAQLTDTHVVESGVALPLTRETARHLALAVDALNALERLDAVVVTGDLAHTGTAAQYAMLRERLDRLRVPYFPVPGNHDHREHFRAAFGDRVRLPAAGPINYAVDRFPLRLIAVDSGANPRGGGSFAPATLRWLDERLAERREATLLFLHHPPYRTRTLLDLLGYEGRRTFERIVRRHPHVAGVVAGHVHRATATTWKRTRLSTAPSTAPMAFPEIFDGRWPFRLRQERPSFALHVWRGERLTTRVVAVDDVPPHVATTAAFGA